MSMLSAQCDELREAARNIQGKLGRCLYRRKDVDEMQQVSGMLFEAADTITSLWNSLMASEAALNKRSETCEVEHTYYIDSIAQNLDGYYERMAELGIEVGE